jgi:hypothetical protein
MTEEWVVDLFVYLFGISLVFFIWSNIITGVNYYLGTHVGLFVTFYIAFLGVLIFRLIINKRKLFFENKVAVQGVIVTLVLLLTANLVSNFQRSLPYREVFRKDLVKYEKVNGVISWISTYNKKNEIYLSDDILSSYIGMYTSSYSLFSKYGVLGMMPTDESVDRYLVSRSLQKTIDRKQFTDELLLYAGLGESTRWDSINGKNKWCKKYKLDIFFGMFCYPEVSLEQYKGEIYWQGLLDKWAENKQNLKNKLSEYGVSYIAWPKDRLEEIDLTRLSLKEVYEDEYYIVYELIKK